jgi:hypothetical protein
LPQFALLPDWVFLPFSEAFPFACSWFANFSLFLQLLYFLLNSF